VGSLQRSPCSGFKGPTSKGKEEREGDIMGGEVRLLHYKFLDPPLGGHGSKRTLSRHHGVKKAVKGP